MTLDADESTGTESLFLGFLATAVHVSGFASTIAAAFALSGALIACAFAIYRKEKFKHNANIENQSWNKHAQLKNINKIKFPISATIAKNSKTKNYSLFPQPQGILSVMFVFVHFLHTETSKIGVIHQALYIHVNSSRAYNFE